MFRRALNVLMLFGILVCVASIAETAIFQTRDSPLAGGHGACEQCGATLAPFKDGDRRWAGSGVFECQKCGWMIDRSYVAPQRSLVEADSTR